MTIRVGKRIRADRGAGLPSEASEVHGSHEMGSFCVRVLGTAEVRVGVDVIHLSDGR